MLGGVTQCRPAHRGRVTLEKVEQGVPIHAFADLTQHPACRLLDQIPAVVEDTLGVILKYQEDVDRISGEVAGRLVNRAINDAGN